MNRGELLRRYVFFIVGLFVNSLGIALITKGDLGTSPISSIPYTLSIGFTPSLGMFTLYYSLLLIVLQLVILRKRFPKQFWLQVPVSLGFSYFIDLSMALLGFLNPQGYPAKAALLLVGCVVLGIGVFMEMAANVVMLPGECTVKAISTTWNTDFGKTKVAVDVTMAASAAVLGLILYQELTGVREGTDFRLSRLEYVAWDDYADLHLSGSFTVSQLVEHYDLPWRLLYENPDALAPGETAEVLYADWTDICYLPDSPGFTLDDTRYASLADFLAQEAPGLKDGMGFASADPSNDHLLYSVSYCYTAEGETYFGSLCFPEDGQ